jgi:NAD(P)-dependent dehydrogenase (short-subunit alcohol dehydrogenase family)
MDLQLKNKTALVTGSTAGIGLAIAHALAKEGASVIVNGRTQLRVDEAVKKSGAAHGIAADLGTEAGAAQVIARFPTVDILVNNLGIFEPKPFDQIADDDWRRFFEVNVLSGVRLSRHYIRSMRQNNWGRIVFISSESALQIPAEMIHYGMTKTAQLAVSRGLAETTAGTAVTVNAVLPGPTTSEGVVEFVDKLAKDQGTDRGAFEREFFRSARPSSIIQRFATPEEVAVAVAFVCSPLASAINGSALRVDGGPLHRLTVAHALLLVRAVSRHLATEQASAALPQLKSLSVVAYFMVDRTGTGGNAVFCVTGWLLLVWVPASLIGAVVLCISNQNHLVSRHGLSENEDSGSVVSPHDFEHKACLMMPRRVLKLVVDAPCERGGDITRPVKSADIVCHQVSAAPSPHSVERVVRE